MEYNPQAARLYFEQKFDGQRIAARDEVSLKCPFHDDRTASLSLHIGKGTWKCHAGCGQGGMLDFEMRQNGGDRAKALETLKGVLGIEPGKAPVKEVAWYDYTDERGRQIFQKVRLEPKSFRCRAKDDSGRWNYRLEGVRKPLYRLHELVTANVVLLAEGEKDCDNLLAAKLWANSAGARVAATCNFDGAGKWRDEYAPYFTGKAVMIFPDNDAVGRQHAEQAASSIAKFAARVKIVTLPGLPEKGDVSDWLENHAAADLERVIGQTAAWKPEERPLKLLEEGMAFASSHIEAVDWAVTGVIQRGGNGIILAQPKVGKSFIAIDLLLSCASGLPWLNFQVPRRMRCAYISREDSPGLTKHRIRSLVKTKGIGVDLDGWLYVNTLEQSPTLDVMNDQELALLIYELKAVRCEFAIFDVFRRLHTEDENDNTVMAKVLAQLTRVKAEVGCALGLVHHVNKDEGGNIFARARGASALHGWTEWGLGITVANPGDHPSARVRRVEFETKQAQPSDPVHFVIAGTADAPQIARIEYHGDDSSGVRSLVRRAQ